MKKTILLTAFVAAVFLSGCTRNETETLTTKTTSITLTATMPHEGANTTRLTLAETDDGNISVRWKDGDKIDLCFVSGETVKTVSGVAVTNIREEGKKGDFAISVPEGITEPFNLYGVYGASIAENSKTVTFPAAPSGAALTDSEPISVMRFVAENLSSSTPPSVQFVHLGAMIGISLTNASEEDYTLTSLSIESSEYDWVYNTAGQATYDIVAGTFSDDKKGTALDFPATNVSISPNATEKVFRWFVPTAMPELSKALTVTINGTETTQSIPAKAFAAGKYYRLRLIWDGAMWNYLKMPSESNLVGYWPFNGNANDESGNNHHGTVKEATLATDRFEKPNSAYYFNGTGQNISFSPDDANFVAFGTKSFSTSFWFKTTSTAGAYLVAFDNCYSSSIWAIRINYKGTGIITGFEAPSSRYLNEVSSNAAHPLNNGIWHLATFIRDASAKKDLLYIDGIFTAELTFSTVNHIDATPPLTFGACGDCCQFFNGYLDDIRIYDKALTQAEVLALYYEK